jgi:hypothetical protein
LTLEGIPRYFSLTKALGKEGGRMQLLLIE